MSHGGMGGGGGDGGGHGHSGGFGLHGHNGHSGGMTGHHADQSPLWSMAMNVGQDPSKRLRIADPRILVAITLFVFIVLISLPYTMDYLQNQRLAKKNGEEVVVAEDSQGPSSAALAMVGATMMGHSVQVPGNAMSAFGGASPAQSVPMPTPFAAPTAASGAPDVFGAPQVAAQSARDTVSQMVAASGLAPSAGARYAATAATPSSYGVSVIPVQTANYSYGGAVRANDQYYVYMPGQAQQLGQAELAMPSQGNAPRIAAALPTMPARPAAIERSPFNPQTSAISSPMGMRLHSAEPTVPMVPSATDGAHRMRVLVSR